MRAHIALRGMVCIILLLVISGCKNKTEELSSDPDFGGFKASANMQPRNVSAIQEQAERAAPVLTPTSATIGPNGGTLASSDGKLSISVPAGAFAADTRVQILPDSNAPDESLGPVYQLSPEGTTFTQPVGLVWHLSDADLSTTNLENLVVTAQMANGQWEAQPDVQRDEASHTISVSTTHFSKWDLALTLRLGPRFQMVFVGDEVLVDAYVGYLDPLPPDMQQKPSQASQSSSDDDLLAPPQKGSSDDDLLATPERDYRRGIFNNAVWRVNGFPLGNSSVGQLVKCSRQWNYHTIANIFCEYIAPTKEPSPNPVIVSVEITVGKQKRKATAKVAVLNYEDHWKGDSSITQSDGSVVTSRFIFAPERPAQSPPSPYSPGGAVAGATVHEYELVNGSVDYKGPKTVSGGACTLSIWPSSYSLGARPSTPPTISTHNPRLPLVTGLGASGGRLVVDMSNPMQWVVSGQGQSQWLATYTTHCPNGDGSMPAAVHAAWWPPDPSNPETSTTLPVPLDPKARPDFTIHVDNGLGHGTVHLHYVDHPPL